MYFVYVLYSLKDHKLYKGFTTDLTQRLRKHNSGGSKSTSNRRPFVLVHLESFEDKATALRREKYLKSLEGGSKLKSYLKQQGIFNKEGKLNFSSE